MAKLFIVAVQTTQPVEKYVVAETPEEAQAKVQLTEGEAIASVQEKGDVIQ